MQTIVPGLGQQEQLAARRQVLNHLNQQQILSAEQGPSQQLSTGTWAVKVAAGQRVSSAVPLYHHTAFVSFVS